MKICKNCTIYLFLLIYSVDSFAQGPKEYFKDKDGFFFYIGMDVPNKTVNLVWDELQSQPVATYILESSTDGKIFNPVISQNAEGKPKDVREMSETEQDNIQTLNTIIYSTETGAGRFVFNELIPNDLINGNPILKSVLENKVDYEDVRFLESSLSKIFKEKQLVYRIKFIYLDGHVKYSGQRSLADYLFFIFKKGLIKAKDMGLLQKMPTPIWPTVANNTLLKSVNYPVSPLAACPAVDILPNCLSPTGNSNFNNGTCCNYTQTEYRGEQTGGAPCSKSNAGQGICAPSIFDCGSNLPSSDPCCAGGGCAHYAVCSCKPWECCVYTQAPVWYVTASNSLTPPTANFTPTNVCLGQTNSFISGSSSSGNSGPITIYAWDLGDGSTSASQNPIHTYTAAGTYSVSLSVTTSNSCVSSITKIVIVNPQPVANFNATTVCLGNATQFTDQSTGGATSWSWDFGDGNTSTQQNPSHTYATSGTFTATLASIGVGGCNSSIPHVVTVNLQPVVNFNITTVCLGNPTQFTDQSTGGATLWNWNFGDGNASTLQNPINTYSASGTYTVTMNATAPGGCNASIVHVATVNPQPIADFSVTTVCLGNATQFSNHSTGGGTQWSWNFGDGNSSALQNPSYTYSVSGTYTATLTATGPGGCNSMMPKIVTVYPQPISDFSANTVCLGNATQFTDQTTGGGTIWNWNFGDGGISTQQNPSHTYTASGTYTVTMNASAVGGCNSNMSKVVTINPQPVADFSATAVCFGLTTQFSDLSTGGGTQWSWNFGDGNTSTQQNPSNTYTAAGTYTATLISTAPGGCNSIMPKQVTVFALPIAMFNIADICLNTNPAAFTDQSVGAVQWIWNFGDGTSNSSLQNPTHIYGAPGTYSISLFVQSVGTCKDSIIHTVNVNPVPDAIFTSNVVCFNNPTQFTDQSLGVPVKWHWYFGDGNSDTIQNPNYTYGTSGTFTVTLIATNSLGCSNTLPRTATVYPLPLVEFAAPTVCIGNSSCFSDLTTIASGVLSTWSWNFNDQGSGTGNISHIQNPCHLYGTVGTYNVFLTVTSNNNCQSTNSLPVSVTVPPVASFTATHACLNSPTSFIDGSTGAVQWNWNFGDGSTSNAQNPTHVYLGYGNYIVTLVASSGGICTDTITDTVTVNPLPIVNFKSDSVCVGKATSFTDESFIPSGNISAWSWNFNDPASGIDNTSNLENPTHIFSSSGTHSVTLDATSTSGCMSSKGIDVIVFPGPIADFSFSPDSPLNLTDEVIFSDLSAGSPVKWWWNFGDKDTSVLRNPDHRYQDMGTYTVTLIVVNQNGCLDTIFKPLEVQEFAFYIPNAFTPGTDGKNDFFFGKGVGIVEYEMQIYDRWGNLVFYCHVNDLPQTLPCMWDGKVMTGSSGERTQEDVFVWKVKLLDIYGETHKYRGTVTLVK